MAYDFQKLADVELLEEVPEGATAFVEVDGNVKRVPGSGLGGGGIATAILRMSAEDMAPTADAPSVEKFPITCDNYTYAQAQATLTAGEPLMVMLQAGSYWMLALAVIPDDEYIIVVLPEDGGQLYWNADGFFNGDPANYNPEK